MNAKEWTRLIAFWLFAGPIAICYIVFVRMLILAFVEDWGRASVGERIFLVLAAIGLGLFGVVSVIVCIRSTHDVLAEARLRRLRGRCRSCGYLRRGNTSGICPECGHAFVQDRY